MAITGFTKPRFDDFFLPRAPTGAADGNDVPADFAAKCRPIEANIASGAFSDWTTFRAARFSAGATVSTTRDVTRSRLVAFTRPTIQHTRWITQLLQASALLFQQRNI